jgi:hypothetical protein
MPSGAEGMATLARTTRTSVLRNLRHPSNYAAHPFFGPFPAELSNNGDDHEQPLPNIDARFSYRQTRSKAIAAQ